MTEEAIEYRIIDYTLDEVPYEVMFMATERTDAIVVVEGKKVHVNKALLSFHSDFFRALFTSNFKEGTMHEIPIGDVSYEDFGRLLSIIYPQNSFPNDKTVEKLLELADRFLIPYVIRQVEHHLLNFSRIDREKMFWMADKYGMPKLLEKSIQQIDSIQKAKKIKVVSDYKYLTDKTKAALFDRLVILTGYNILESKNNKGITCTWTGQLIDNCKSIRYTWNFDWNELKKEGIDRLTGYINMRKTDSKATENVRMNIFMTAAEENYVKTIPNSNMNPSPAVSFDYHLTPHRKTPVDTSSFEVMFMFSELTDAILVVNGKKMHVNKAFLSFHSEYFRALFKSNFKEGKADEIPIEDVSFEDFARLLSMVYPQNEFPNDSTVEKLLEYADRFKMPSVNRKVEYHLLNLSKIGNEKMMWMADKYDMPKLLQKSMEQVNSPEKANKIKMSSDYKKLSDKTKAKLFEHLASLV